MYARNLFVGNQNHGLVQNCVKFFGVGEKIGRSIASIKLHTFHNGKFGFDGFAFVNGNNTVFANLFHGVCDQFANCFVACRNTCNLSDTLFVFNGLANFFQSAYRFFSNSHNTFFEDYGICTCGKVFQSFSYDRLSQNRSGSCAVACNVVGFDTYFSNKACAHIFEGVFQNDFFSDGYTVVSDKGRGKLLFQNYVTTFGA